ncbi:hypothetical protein BHE74_00050960 [Ensete ventricosum]|nr:hypothetical protein BHE74_00050960 [Ensete ventricosum]
MNRMLSEDGELQKDLELIPFQVTQIIPFFPSIYPPPPPARLPGGEARLTSPAHMGDISSSNGNGSGLLGDGRRKSCWYEEEIEQNLRWCFALNRVSQALCLKDIHDRSDSVDAKWLQHSAYRILAVSGHRFTGHEALRQGQYWLEEHPTPARQMHLLVLFLVYQLQALVLDGKLQSAEMDEFIYHESLFDVIVGDLADPIEGGPCYKLYTKSFYEETLKPRLNQADDDDDCFCCRCCALLCSHSLVRRHLGLGDGKKRRRLHLLNACMTFVSRAPAILNWRHLQASDSPFTLDADKLDSRIRQRIEGENRYVDGKTFASASILSKAVRKSYGLLPSLAKLGNCNS